MHEIPTELLQKILNYLQTKPFNEVAPLISAIQKTAKPIESTESGNGD